jgi:NAD(P)-dependent dehydrogenase (short-subunit alcohol dehydrogenase family)
VVHLASHNPSHIYFTGRNAKQSEGVRTEAAASGSKTALHFLECDFTSLASVRAAADVVLAEQDRLDVLMANAGVMDLPPSLTKDGYELQFGINYMAHALLVRRLLPLLQKAPEARVVVLTSAAFRATPIAFDELKTTQDKFKVMGGIMRYGQSKLADLLLAKELARRYPAITTVAVTPGIVHTDLVRKQTGVHYAITWLSAQIGQGGFIKTERGAYSQLWCVAAPKEKLVPGALYEPVGVLSKMSSKHSKDEKLPGKLWEWTDAELKKWD